MAEIKRSILFGKLNSLCYKAIESATVFCKLRGNPYVELGHWVHQLLNLQDSDVHRIARHFNLDASLLATDLTHYLDQLPRGATSITDFSPHLEQSVERSWIYATLLFSESTVRSGHLIYGILNTEGLKNVLLGFSPQWSKVKVDALGEAFESIVSGSPEDGLRAQDGSSMAAGAVPGETSAAMAPAAMGKQEALEQFSVDLTERAREGEMDPILGRDEEIRQIIDILMRRRQNNPILTGEAGVGKTAVVEGFAQKIASGNVPPPLKDVTLRTLDLGLLQAGASMKGEFENRLKQVIEETQSSAKPIILFIDEAHTLIGAGGAAGQGDAANLLKPALARGTLRTIAATTWAEYKKYFEKDPALTRRFQVVKIEEPTEEQAAIMIRGLAAKLEKHHNVQVLGEAVESAVRLSHRYIPARQLPDKAVSLIDTACARVAIGQHAVPSEVEDSRHKIDHLKIEMDILEREISWGLDRAARKAEVLEQLSAEQERLKGLEARWKKEKALVENSIQLREKLRKQVFSSKEEEPDQTATSETITSENSETVEATVSSDGEDRATLLEDLKTVENELLDLQGEAPLILSNVGEPAVASVVADWTGIPVGRMVKDEIQAVLNLVDNLEKRVIGQRHALESIAKRIRTSRAGLDNPKKPIGVFLLTGPSGVGKTESALALAETLYGGENNLITINMSEFQEAHTVSTLKGAPPGYVGYGEGGVLTEAVRRRPYSVVLLDEIEKAHSDVHEIFFQVFDKGEMEDGEGRLIDFRNTIIILTTNVGSELIMNLCKDPDLMPELEGMVKALREPLLKVFPAALLGRMLTVPFHPLSDEIIKKIIALQLSRIQKRLQENQKVPFTYDDAVLDLIASRCTEVESGGRMVDAILTNTLLPEISKEFLTRMMQGNPVMRVHIGVDDKGAFCYQFDS